MAYRELLLQIMALNAQGYTLDEIVDRIKDTGTYLTPAQVRQIIEDKGRKCNEKGALNMGTARPGGYAKITDEIKAQAIELIGQGLNDREIAARLGIGKSSVYRLRKQHDGGKKPVPEKAKVNEDFEKAVDEMINERQDKQALTPDAPKEDKPAKECPKWIDDLERGFMGIYGTLSPEERHAWDLGELFAIVSHKRAQYI